MKFARAGLIAGGTTVTALALAGLFVPASAAEPATVCATGCDYTTIQAAVDAASNGDVITVNGPLTVSGTTTINKDVTVTGASGAKVTQSASAITFLITGGGATLSNLEITSDLAYPVEFVQVGADDVTVSGNTIYGPEQTGPMAGWVGDRGVVTQGAITGFEATGNTIYSLRTGFYLNPNGSGTIADNTLYNTKGDFLIDNANFTFTGNRAGNPAQLSEWSFVVFANTDPARYTDLAALSTANHNMSAWDQRTGEQVVRPLTADACKNGGWQTFSNPAFPNQGQCIQFVNTGKVGTAHAPSGSTSAPSVASAAASGAGKPAAGSAVGGGKMRTA